MKLNDPEVIKRLFQAGCDEKTALDACMKYDEKKDMVANKYMIYSFAALPDLIEKMKKISDWDNTSKSNARYVVEEDGTMWFAFESRPGDSVQYPGYRVGEQVPAHSVMAPRNAPVIASGIIVFSEDYQIQKITNFSGHFRPHPRTLVWPLAALIHSGADFTAIVELGFISKSNGQQQHQVASFSKAEWSALLPEKCTVAPNSVYEIWACSYGEWEQFSAEQAVCFKNKPARTFSSSSAASRTVIDDTPFPFDSFTENVKSRRMEGESTALVGQRLSLSVSALSSNSSQITTFSSVTSSSGYESPPSSRQAPRLFAYSSIKKLGLFSDRDNDDNEDNRDNSIAARHGMP